MVLADCQLRSIHGLFDRNSGTCGFFGETAFIFDPENSKLLPASNHEFAPLREWKLELLSEQTVALSYGNNHFRHDGCRCSWKHATGDK